MNYLYDKIYIFDYLLHLYCILLGLYPKKVVYLQRKRV